MNVFILSTGRCGSTTFAKACNHIVNYSSSHESRINRIGFDRISYPDDHIESDNRLSWLLGRLDEHYGDAAIYVHLTRDPELVAESFLNRYNSKSSIMYSYARCIIMNADNKYKRKIDICRDYVLTVNQNINAFLKDKSRKMSFELESAERDFETFWRMIGAEGNYDSALAEFNIKHNSR